MSSINEIQDEIVEEFSISDDWMDRYQMLIDLGNDQEELPAADKTESNIIDGCQSRVWIVCEYRDGRLYFRGESDALIVKGLVALLLKVVDGQTPHEIIDADLYFVSKIGLSEHLSPTRSNGLVAMINKIRTYAIAYQSQES